MHRPIRRLLIALLGGATLVACVAALPSGPAGAAGTTTHAWMGLSAIERVDDPALTALLDAHRDQVRSGSMFPDGGYLPGTTHGEEAHWSRFTDAYAARLMARDDCGDITRPDGPCAAQVAHLMGVVAHGTGDEVWDWLFEPLSPDLDEYYLPEELLPVSDGGGAELVMDIVAVGVHDRPVGPLPPLPSQEDILATFRDVGRTDVTPEMLDRGQLGQGIISQAVASFVPQHLPGVLEGMPYMSANLIDAPGGVSYAATAIAGQWDSMWGRLLGDQPPTEVSITHPADGERGVPATGWERDHLPGSSPGRGGARTRVAASLTYSLPYRVPGGPGVSDQLPPGAMTLTEAGGSDALATWPGFPRAVPYGADAGEHTIGLQPTADLAPCTWYEAATTEALLDAQGDAVTPHRWSFRTGLDAAGSPCPDDPGATTEDHVRQIYRDVLARTPSAGEVRYWSDRVVQGLSPEGLASAILGSAEARGRMVDLVYLSDLGRPSDPDGRTFWTEYIRTRSVSAMRTLVLASPEVYARGGGTDQGYVAHLYEVVLGRPADAAGSAFWTGRLAAGASRASVARLMLVSPEVSRRAVRTTHTGLLGRPASAEEIDLWAPVVSSSDVRPLVRALLASPEYVEAAQIS